MSTFIIPPPPSFVINGDNVEDRFVDYKNKFERFLKGNGLDVKEEGQKVAIFKHYCGEDLLLQIEADETEDDTLNDILQRLEDYYTPAANVLQEQFKFFTRRQRPNENFDKYLIEMKKIAKNCGFGENEENLLKVVLIMNVRDHDEQQKFLKDSDSKKLDTLVPDFRKYDATKKPARKISQADSGKNAKQQDAAKKNQQNSQSKPGKQPNQNQNQPQPPKQKQQPPQPHKQQPPQQKQAPTPPQPQKQNAHQNPGKNDSNATSQPKGNNMPKSEPKKKQKSKPNNANPIDVLADVEERIKNLCS